MKEITWYEAHISILLKEETSSLYWSLHLIPLQDTKTRKKSDV